MSTLPPQRHAGAPGQDGMPGQGGVPGPKAAEKGAQEAEKRIGKPCYYTGQKVQGVFACVACQFQIRNRAGLPVCPDCGEVIWAYMQEGPRPVPEGEALPVAEPVVSAPVSVEEGVSLDPTPPSVTVQEGVRLDT